MRVTSEITLYNARALAKELGLEKGMVIRGKVDGFANGKAIINMGGKRVVAESFVPLSMGETIYLKLEEQYGSKLIFRLITKANVGRLVGGSIDFLSLLLKENWKVNPETLSFWMNIQKMMGLNLKELFWISLWTKGLGLPVNWEMAKIAMLFYHKSRNINKFAKHLLRRSPEEFLSFVKDTSMEELLYWQIRFNHTDSGYKFFIVPFGEEKRLAWVFVREREQREREGGKGYPQSAVIWVDMPQIGKIGILVTLSGISVNVIFNSENDNFSFLVERHREKLRSYLEDVGFALAKLGIVKLRNGAGNPYLCGIDMEV